MYLQDESKYVGEVKVLLRGSVMSMYKYNGIESSSSTAQLYATA